MAAMAVTRTSPTEAETKVVTRTEATREGTLMEAVASREVDTEAVIKAATRTEAATKEVTRTGNRKAARVVATAVSRLAVVALTRLTLVATEPTARETASLLVTRLETKEVEVAAAVVNLAVAKMTRATVDSKEETRMAKEVKEETRTEATRPVTRMEATRVVARTAATTTTATTTKLCVHPSKSPCVLSRYTKMKIVNLPSVITASIYLLALVLDEHQPIWS